MDNPKEQFPPFYGRKDGKEDPNEFVENVEFVVEEREYTNVTRKATALRFTFRLHLREKAYEWYQKVAYPHLDQGAWMTEPLSGSTSRLVNSDPDCREFPRLVHVAEKITKPQHHLYQRR